MKLCRECENAWEKKKGFTLCQLLQEQRENTFRRFFPLLESHRNIPFTRLDSYSFFYNHLPFLSPACFLLNFYVFLLNTSAPLETDLTSVFQTFISASFFDEINTDFLIGPPHLKKKKKSTAMWSKFTHPTNSPPVAFRQAVLLLLG